MTYLQLFLVYNAKFIAVKGNVILIVVNFTQYHLQ